jgi:4-amino-4-deoxy-L-arabinose transferase-like glycosyltransferase
MQSLTSSANKDRIYKWLAFTAIALGIAVRLAVYLQNRNLMIDEANIARNIYERGFGALALPLSYEQYAPPVWLWVIKALSALFGFSEQALRLFPLLSGIVSVFLMYAVLKTLTSLRSLWYPLALMCFSFMFIRYATELKQYTTDVMVVLSLILLALKTDILQQKVSQFLLTWLLAGSVAIWLCMPSVFVLAGIGGYYFFICLQNKVYKKITLIIILSFIWIAQFALYYLLILKDQANSQYLQNFHKDYFLSAMPTTFKEWDHNFSLMGQVLGEAAGFTFLAKAMHTVFIAWCGIRLFFKNRPLFSLLFVPFLLLLVAAAVNQFSMIPRVVLFIMPILLIMIGTSLDILLHIKKVFLQATLIVACLLCIINSSALRFMFIPLESEQLTDALDFTMKQGIQSGNNIYLHSGAVPSFIYYTTIHPDSSKWNKIKDAHKLNWESSYADIALSAPMPSAFIFTSIYDADLEQKKKQIEQHMHLTNSLVKQGSIALIYSR